MSEQNNFEKWSKPAADIPPGHSAKFPILWRDRIVQAFVVNFRGSYHAYVNRCMHAGTPLDWWPNEFFDESGELLKCGTHGALYRPATGKCAGGPCSGMALFQLRVEVLDGNVVVTAD